MTHVNLIHAPVELARQEMDVLVIGSGPAGVAFTERLYEAHPTARIGVLERGSVLTLTHINNIFPNEQRRPFIDKFKIKPWLGAFFPGGMLLPALGGRGIASGAHLRRFDPPDFHLWANGRWPDALVAALPDYYRDAEIVRRVSVSSIRGPSQTWALGTLHTYHAYPPPVGVDLWADGGFDVGRGYDSSVSRLWRLLINDALSGRDPRLFVATNAYATSVTREGPRAGGVECLDTTSGGAPVLLRARFVVLAASTVESARLFLNSGLGPAHPAAGCYLAEHIERRAKIKARAPSPGVRGQGVSAVIPPRESAAADTRERFQIHLRGQPDDEGNLIIDIGGFAAMDPDERNCVTLSDTPDEFGVPRAHTRLELSEDDAERTERMCGRIREVAGMLGGEFITGQFPFEDVEPKFTDATGQIQEMDPGRSYHEAGTLRMGADPETSVTDDSGQARHVNNLYVADASLFPCVGIANPMLTITALAYRVADRLAARL